MYGGKVDGELPTHTHVHHTRIDRGPSLGITLLVQMGSFTEEDIGVVSANGVADHGNPNQVNRLIRLTVKHDPIVRTFVLGTVACLTNLKATGDGAAGWVNQWVEWVTSGVMSFIKQQEAVLGRDLHTPMFVLGIRDVDR